jgi:large subunit ribosomal protein L9
MKVILLERYRKLGEVGEVVNVKNGYARNFLLPSKKAIMATNENVAYFDSKKAELKKASDEKRTQAEKISTRLEGVFVTLVKQAGDDGRLFGSVTSQEIAEETSKKSGEQITRKQIIVNSQIKYIGIYAIDVDLGEGVFSKANVNVARSEAEANEAVAKFKRGEISYGAQTLDMQQKQKAALLAAEDQAAQKAAADAKAATATVEGGAAATPAEGEATEAGAAEATTEEKPKKAKKAKAE